MSNVPEESLTLPRIAYGSICNKFLTEFMEHHKISGDLPTQADAANVALAKIFDLILKSMGEEKRRQCIDDAKAYRCDIPYAAR